MACAADGSAHLVEVLAALDQHLGAGGNVQPRFDGAEVAQADAAAGIGANEAVFADADFFFAATRERAHQGGAATQIGTVAHDHAGRDTTFDHAGAEGAGIEVHEAFVHDRCSFAQIGA